MSQHVLSGGSDYLKSGYAKTYQSTAGTQEAVDSAELDRLHDGLLRDGYVILQRIVPEEQIDRISAELRELLPDSCGRNGFEGTLTQRIYAVISKTLACNPLVEHHVMAWRRGKSQHSIASGCDGAVLRTLGTAAGKLQSVSPAGACQRVQRAYAADAGLLDSSTIHGHGQRHAPAPPAR